MPLAIARDAPFLEVTQVRRRRISSEAAHAAWDLCGAAILDLRHGTYETGDLPASQDLLQPAC